MEDRGNVNTGMANGVRACLANPKICGFPTALPLQHSLKATAEDISWWHNSGRI